MKVSLYEKVALKIDILEHRLKKGDVAAVVEILPPGPHTNGEEGVALEVFNAVGDTLAVVIVPLSAVEPLLPDEVLQVRALSN